MSLEALNVGFEILLVIGAVIGYIIRLERQIAVTTQRMASAESRLKTFAEKADKWVCKEDLAKTEARLMKAIESTKGRRKDD